MYSFLFQEMGGPHIPWRPGRIDGTAINATPDGRLPDGAQGADHLRSVSTSSHAHIFSILFNFRSSTVWDSMTKRSLPSLVLMPLAAAIQTGKYQNARALEFLTMVSLSRSGFQGPWTFSPTTLTNDYYKLLFEERWVWKKWNGPKQLEDKKTRSLMMLPCVILLFSFEATYWFAVRTIAWFRTRASRSMPRHMLRTRTSSSRSRHCLFVTGRFFNFFVPSTSFSNVVSRLFELGVPEQQFASSDHWTVKTVEEQKDQK